MTNGDRLHSPAIKPLGILVRNSKKIDEASLRPRIQTNHWRAGYSLDGQRCPQNVLHSNVRPSTLPCASNWGIPLSGCLQLMMMMNSTEGMFGSMSTGLITMMYPSQCRSNWRIPFNNHVSTFTISRKQVFLNAGRCLTGGQALGTKNSIFQSFKHIKPTINVVTH